jgi:hypothetical protein
MLPLDLLGGVWDIFMKNVYGIRYGCLGGYVPFYNSVQSGLQVETGTI